MSHEATPERLHRGGEVGRVAAIFTGVFGSDRDRVAVAHLDGSCVVAPLAPGARLVGVAPDDGALWVDDGGLLHEIALPATTAPSDST